MRSNRLETALADAVVNGPTGDAEQLSGMVQGNAAADTGLKANFAGCFVRCHFCPPDGGYKRTASASARAGMADDPKSFEMSLLLV